MALLDRIAKYNIGMNTGGSGVLGSDFVRPGELSQTMPKVKPMEEVGVTGLLRTRGMGYVFEEWLTSLSTYRAKQIYREMRDNDAVIGAMFFALEMILRKAEWRVEPGHGPKAQQYAEFVESNMQDMSHPWEDFVSENVNMFAFGFGLFETVYKRRNGPDGRKASRFDDGLIGWRKFAPRAQESILYWIWDDEGGLQGAVQLAAPDYHTVPIPIEKLLLFRTTTLKGNPEGRSLLRNCFRSWFFKRRIEEVEGIGIERDLCGIPVLYATGEALLAMGGKNAAAKIVRDIRIDDQMGVVLPQAFDDKGNQQVKLELLQSGGQKQASASETIQRYNSDILNTVLAGFVQFGQTANGNRALHLSATEIFSLAVSAYMDSTAAVINRIAIPRLMSLNRMDLSQAPKLVPGEIGVQDIDELSTAIQQLSQAGLTFFDIKTQNHVRKIAHLPELPEDVPAPASAQTPPGASSVPGVAQPLGTPPVKAPAPKAPPKENEGEGAERLTNAV